MRFRCGNTWSGQLPSWNLKMPPIRARPKGKKSGQNASSFDLRTEVVCGNRLTTSQWNGCSDGQDRPDRGWRVLDASFTGSSSPVDWMVPDLRTNRRQDRCTSERRVNPTTMSSAATVFVTKPKLPGSATIRPPAYASWRSKAIAAKACRLACLFDWLFYHEQP